jgi:hypothetical protein
MAGSTLIGRMRVALTWPDGGPGVNTVYFTTGTGGTANDWDNAAAQFYGELAASYQAMHGAMVVSCRWEVEDAVDIIDVASGNIVNQISAGNQNLYGMGGDTGQNQSRATQVFVNFGTDVWQDGVRLRGGLYYGPIGGIALTGAGEVTQGTRDNIEDNFVALTSGVGPRLAVYHRPKPGTGEAGYYGDVITVRCKTRPAILKSRRD